MDIAEVFADPNIAARNLLFDMPHPKEARVQQLGFPFKMEKTPASARRRPPMLGEHNEEVLCEYLSMTAEEVAVLKRDAVI
jgi:crotonobetainyl-CoA:carnitine CoA-transferase CaiB-like acyl-CoA transferase